MHSLSPPEFSRIAQDLQVRRVQVENVVQLLEEGNTVPFITRYRKERTGGLNEEVIRQIQSRLSFLRAVHDRKQTILKSIDHQGRLTDELRQEILAADTMRRLEDLYLPYKPKKRNLGNAARERGLEPLALAIWHSDPVVGSFDELLPTLLNPEKGLNTADDVRSGVGHLLSEYIAESADIRAPVRATLWEAGKIAAVKGDKVPEGQGHDYKDYFGFSESARQIPAHRILALNRGEREGVLKVHLDFSKEYVREQSLHLLGDLLLRKANELPPVVAVPNAAPPVEMSEAAAPTETVVGTEAAGIAFAADGSVAAGMFISTVDVFASAAPAPLPAAAPLVAEMAPKQPVQLTGEPLSPHSEFRTPHHAILTAALDDALTRLLMPSLEREIRGELTQEAEGHAVATFARNLSGLLLQPPLHARRVLAIDPGFRTGCKVAALDEFGNLLDHVVIYPFAPLPRKGRESKSAPAAPPAPPAMTATAVATTDSTSPLPMSGVIVVSHMVASESVPLPAPDVVDEAQDSAVVPAEPVEDFAPFPDAAMTPEAPPAVTIPTIPASQPVAAPSTATAKRAEAKSTLKELIVKHQLQVVALGNGTGCRETEELISELIAAELPELAYVIVNEAGASVYSVSQVGREEFPTYDATLRSAITIGRRLQDPLSELVKVEPQSIGVGLYQHDMGRREMKETLEGVVESCVNQVGVDLNIASVPLLRHIAGLNQMVARELVDWRKQHGPYTSREQILQVPGVGPQRWVQAAGFLKIPGAANPLDRTWIHPESYGLAEKILADLGYATSVLDDKNLQPELHAKLSALNIEETARKYDAGPPTVYDVMQALLKPGRDPREELPPPVFKKGILRIEDLKPGMELKGTVLNVVDFGAFIDIGLKDSGLVHISQIANKYIKSPHEVVAVNDVVNVWVMNVDLERRRVSLTMIAPGTDRPPQERRPRRDDQRPPPPRGRRPGGPPPGPGAPSGTAEHGVESGPPRHGGGGFGQGRGPRAPRGRQPGRGPGRPPQPAHADGAPPVGGTAPSAEHGRSAPPPPPPRRPRREPPKPKLTQAALEGKVPLRTFGELSALFAAKKDKDVPPPAPAGPASAGAAPGPATDLPVPPVESNPVETPPAVAEIPPEPPSAQP